MIFFDGENIYIAKGKISEKKNHKGCRRDNIPVRKPDNADFLMDRPDEIMYIITRMRNPCNVSVIKVWENNIAEGETAYRKDGINEYIPVNLRFLDIAYISGIFRESIIF